MSREWLRKIGQETVQIIRDEKYKGPDGQYVCIGAQLSADRALTRSYPPDWRLPGFPAGQEKTYIDVVNETTLAAAAKLTNPVVLNFASGINPGGGFLNGSQAQEEHIARSSTLYACLEDNPMYAFHRSRKDAMCTNYAIYSSTLVIRDEHGQLLPTPWPCAVITCAAPNVGAVRWQNPALLDDIAEVFQERINKVLTIAAHHGHKEIVLGAWGCGVYANDPITVAQLFERALLGDFAGVFSKVVFAVYDTSAAGVCITPFAKQFGLKK